MKKLKILIIEDELPDVTLLQELILLDNKELVEQFYVAEDYDAALKLLIGKNRFDLSILDVNLKGEKVFKLVESFPQNKFGQFAFVTNEEIPRRIISLTQPLLVIDKPFDREQIAKFICEAVELIKNATCENSERVAFDLLRIDNAPKLFGISGVNGIYSVFVENIYCVYVDDKMTEVFYFDHNENTAKKKRSNESLSSMKARLEAQSDLFVQIHKSWLVNVRHIIKITSEVDADMKGDGTVYLNNKQCEKIPIGGTFKEKLEKKMNLKIKHPKKR